MVCRANYFVPCADLKMDVAKPEALERRICRLGYSDPILTLCYVASGVCVCCECVRGSETRSVRLGKGLDIGLASTEEHASGLW